MSTSKHIDKICLAAVALTLVLTILFMCGGSLGLTAAAKTVKYEGTLFDTSYVHKIDIVMDDWDSFIESCENEEYASCTVVVDGKKHANIAIRAKGNTSLSSVKSMGSQRYSFKLEFDHNESGKSLDGLDKLCLNNLIQDNTMMKDYLAYRMMADFGVDAPLCSFAYLTVNGEDWGLYLAVEGVEDSFLARNYGSDTGDLYKPDSMSFGGGRGNGKDFNFDDLDFDFGFGDQGKEQQPDTQTEPAETGLPGGEASSQGEGGSGGEGQESGSGGEGRESGSGGEGGQFPGQSGEGGQPGGDNQQGGFPGGGFPGRGFGGGFGGMGSDDVKLKYIDDDPDSYSNIFSSAKTDVSNADQKRLISSLKQLSSYENLEEVLDMDEVLRYFVVHNFVVNGDSYTGSMIHNYYLHEKDGKLGMIPWDYNLAFGTFQAGDAASSVNTSIDEPVNGDLDDRPMIGWIFSDESYTEQYHALFTEFIQRWFSNGELEALIAETAEMIRPYVEKDPTKFCTTEEFEAGVEAISDFVSLRGEAVSRQLAGDESAVETGDLKLSDMGSMGGGGGTPGGQGSPGGEGGPGGTPGQMPGGFTPPSGESGEMPTPPDGQSGQSPTPPDGQSGQSSMPPDGWNPNESPTGNGNGERPSPSGKGDSGERPQPPEGGGNFDPRGGTQAGSSGTTFWMLLGVSVLVLAGGILMAIKKKY
ncbi:MAG: CotH kinase family protein [Oscillospiraceae bacterium]|nr:CotH kinase family protein [Oscillospiraceae bacterium]